MNINLDSECVRFFENEGRAFAAGDRRISLYDLSLKGENALVAPYGIQNFNGKECLKVILTPECALKIKEFENDMVEKMKISIPKFLDGTDGFHSMVKTDFEGNTIFTLKLAEKVNIETYDVKKGTFSKTLSEKIPSGARVSLGMKVFHPWKFDIKGVVKYGIRIAITEIIAYDSTELKRKGVEPKVSIKDYMVSNSKKRVKLIDHKDL